MNGDRKYMKNIIRKIKKKLRFLYIFLILLNITNCSPKFKWSDSLDPQTMLDSWGTYNEFFAHENSIFISREQFMKSLKAASYKDISAKEFLTLNIENHRLSTYLLAQTPEEAYPLSDRPRGQTDISSVNYFLAPREPVPPITVACMIDKKGQQRMIKLDGVHRMIAANILRKKLRVVFIDLRKLCCTNSFLYRSPS